SLNSFNADISCKSEFGKWTEFTITFPKVSEEVINKLKPESQKKKILLVDDQQVNLLTTKARIEKTLPNISCDIAKSGKEAINMAKQNKYHLILMDIQMPEIDGIETTKRIRSYDKEIPIIALTSLDRETFLQMADRTGPESRKAFN